MNIYVMYMDMDMDIIYGVWYVSVGAMMLLHENFLTISGSIHTTVQVKLKRNGKNTTISSKH